MRIFYFSVGKYGKLFAGFGMMGWPDRPHCKNTSFFVTVLCFSLHSWAWSLAIPISGLHTTRHLTERISQKKCLFEKKNTKPGRNEQIVASTEPQTLQVTESYIRLFCSFPRRGNTHWQELICLAILRPTVNLHMWL
jgi:hypothetical protein